MDERLRLNYQEIIIETPDELEQIVQDVKDELWALFLRSCLSRIEYTQKVMEVLNWKREKIKQFNN